MKLETYEAIVENGQIKLTAPVRLPERAKVHVIVPNGEPARFRGGSPRLAQRNQAADFIKTVAEEG